MLAYNRSGFVSLLLGKLDWAPREKKSSTMSTNNNNNEPDTSQITAKITQTKKITENTKKPYIVYVITVTTDVGNSWQVDRRFREFALIRDDVKKVNRAVANRFPCRLSSFLPRSEAHLIQQRRVVLTNFLTCLIADARLLALESVRSFLKLDTELDNPDNGWPEIDLGSPEKQKPTPADFCFMKVVGKGSFAKVLQAEHVAERKLYAIKVIQKREVVLRQEVRHVMSERMVLQRNKQHPFLVRLHYAFQTRDKLFFVLDFVNGGELFLHLQRDGPFQVERARFHAAEIAAALGFLHSENIIFRDLKPENILLDSEGHIVLTDFGLSRVGGFAGTFCGTPEYLAPEVLLKERYSFSVDWWALGCVLFEMLCGLPPFYSSDHEEMYRGILSEDPTFPQNVYLPESAENILISLLDKDPFSRLGSMKDFAEVRRHSFFSPIDWDLLVKKEVTPPFKPNVANLASLEYFDPAFTNESVSASVGLKSEAVSDLFAGFTFESPGSPKLMKPGNCMVAIPE